MDTDEKVTCHKGIGVLDHDEQEQQEVSGCAESLSGGIAVTSRDARTRDDPQEEDASPENRDDNMNVGQQQHEGEIPDHQGENLVASIAMYSGFQPAQRRSSRPGAVSVIGNGELGPQGPARRTGGTNPQERVDEEAPSFHSTPTDFGEVVTHATVVSEPPIYEASELKERAQPFCTVFGRKMSKRCVFLFLVFLVTAVIGTGLFIALATKSSSSPEDSKAATELRPTPPPPTPAPPPTRYADPRDYEITQVISNISGTALDDLASPQSVAMSWLIDKDPLTRNASSPYLIQRYVLMLIFHSLGGELWKDKTGYGTGTNECSWFGITCGDDGYVQKIDLPQNYLVGPSIPNEISSLSHLKSLYLSQNSIRGTMPTSIGKLAELTNMRLDYNVLTGGIPSEIGNLSNLTHLNLVRNDRLTGTIPSQFAHLTDLKQLKLSSNINGTFPSPILGMTSLEVLTLLSCKIGGKIPTEIGNLVKLTGLTLSVNELTGSVVTELGNLLQLKFLNLDTNRLTGVIPSELGLLTNLKRIKLHRNDLTGTAPYLCDHETLTQYSSDCKGPIPEVQCPCCTDCCNDTLPNFLMLGALC